MLIRKSLPSLLSESVKWDISCSHQLVSHTHERTHTHTHTWCYTFIISPVILLQSIFKYVSPPPPPLSFFMPLRRDPLPLPRHRPACTAPSALSFRPQLSVETLAAAAAIAANSVWTPQGDLSYFCRPLPLRAGTPPSQNLPVELLSAEDFWQDLIFTHHLLWKHHNLCHPLVSPNSVMCIFHTAYIFKAVPLNNLKHLLILFFPTQRSIRNNKQIN